MTTIHQINLSDDAYHLLAFIIGAWVSAESRPDGIAEEALTDEESNARYRVFTVMILRRFGFPLGASFHRTLDELYKQFPPRVELEDQP